ncbi:MAG: APC family permease, partial [Malacoplasma sp.]|nr:APC family permease [Malacoplasma sp.]
MTNKNTQIIQICDKKKSDFANAPTMKKIGFFSAMLVVVGSSVGAGIFFKAGAVLNESQGSIVFAMFCWLFAGFAVISMALALIEIASARNDNFSIIGWCQTFNSRFTYKSCKNFMTYIYLPLTFFFMPLYSIMSIQDGIGSLFENYNGFGTNADWAIMMVFAIMISTYFIVANGLSSKLGNIHNLIILSVKFLPLIFATILGFVIVGINGKISTDSYGVGFNPTDFSNESFSFSQLSPGFGMFIAIGGIFFAYDGFYVTAGIQSEMKKPSKTPFAILFGLVIVTIIYLTISLSMSLGAQDGNPFGYLDFLKQHNLLWLYATFQILIGIGVLGIVNGFAMWSPRLLFNLIKINEVPFSDKVIGSSDKKTKINCILYDLVLTIPIIILFSIIGGLGYVNSSGYSDSYGTGVAQLYSFADLMANWTSVIAFAFIVFSIFGGIKNRKTNKVKVSKNKFFYPMAIISMIFMSLPIFMTYFGPIADLFMLFKINPNTSGFVEDILIPRIMVIVVLILFISFMVVPILIEDYLLKKKYGSIEKGEIVKIEKIANLENVSLKEKLIEIIKIEKRNTLN